MNISNKIFKFVKFIRQYKFYRRLIFLILDTIVIITSWLFTLFITSFESLNSFNFNFIWLLVPYLVIGIPIYFLTGQYKSISSHEGISSFFNIIKRNFFIAILCILFGLIFNFNIPKLAFWIIFSFIIINLKILTINLIKEYLLIQKNSRKFIPRVAIYGAGSAGALLSSSLNAAKTHKIIFFIDDNPLLENRTIDGINIINSKYLKNNIKKIDQILIAIPSLSRSKRSEIIKNLQCYPTKILQIPGIVELTEEKVKINDLKPILIEDLLSREQVDFNKGYIEEIINNKVICIVGAGGSIGSELSRQISKFMPSKLVLIDNHEFSLYNIEIEIKQKINVSTNLVSHLCDAKEYNFLLEIVNLHNVDIIFHAAAYKHVPLVEKNPIQGTR
mgnify:CR=1 FL=1